MNRESVSGQVPPAVPAVRAREDGLKLIGRINRWLIGGAIAAAGLLSLLAAHAFHGHTIVAGGASASSSAPSSSSSGSGASSSSSSSSNAGGSGLQAPAQAPGSASAASAPVVSGGS